MLTEDVFWDGEVFVIRLHFHILMNSNTQDVKTRQEHCLGENLQRVRLEREKSQVGHISKCFSVNCPYVAVIQNKFLKTVQIREG